ncbi:MAG: hypothetical protein IPI31_07010 [Bacteroidetes bacterium]|nr:hypothetical protein [Bacteroidota bacterium]
MKKVITILITIIYLSGIFSPFYALAGYYMHKDYIVENLCINQSKPEMDCEGKCYLKKQIVSEVTKNAGRSTNLPDETNTNYFTPHFTTSSEGIYLFPIYIDLKTDFFASAFDFNYAQIIFSPPKLIV